MLISAYNDYNWHKQEVTGADLNPLLYSMLYNAYNTRLSSSLLKYYFTFTKCCMKDAEIWFLGSRRTMCVFMHA